MWLELWRRGLLAGKTSLLSTTTLYLNAYCPLLHCSLVLATESIQLLDPRLSSIRPVLRGVVQGAANATN